MSLVLATALAVFVRPVISAFARWPHGPWPFGAVDAMARLLLRPRHTYRRAVRLPNCPAEMITPVSARPGDAILYLHGGGFITCGLNTHRRLAADIARAAASTALAVCYRQLRKAKLAEALDDAVDGYRELLARGHAPGDISIVGDSAGGYLALATALAVQRLGLGRPGAVVVISPVTSVDAEAPSLIDFDDPLLTAPALRAIWRMLSDGGPDADRYLPLNELANLPPTLIQVGTREVVYPGSLVLAGQLAVAGVPHQLQIWEGQFHVFQAAAPVLEPARRAVAEIGTFLQDKTFHH
ncbi:alpha/beta hydrolase [Mycobacterium hubeiense]|uniref:alpha/beta hydrolase n=1 Tax=Mycobacterium hubeiense TaxID=1867256 RepID=UPI000C7F518F|nr:alpha/beta hydrolase [Mycobacterium sp. QGD 101]